MSLKTFSEMALLMNESYANKNSRKQTITFKNKEYQYNKEKSNDLCAIYESDSSILLLIHGASNAGLTFDALLRFVSSERGSSGLRMVKDALRYVNSQKKKVIVVSHSLGSHLYIQASIRTNISFTHFSFGGFSPSPNNFITKKLASDNKSTKILYVDDSLANNILKVSKNKRKIKKFKSESTVFNIKTRNGHSLVSFQNFDVLNKNKL